MVGEVRDREGDVWRDDCVCRLEERAEPSDDLVASEEDDFGFRAPLVVEYLEERDSISPTGMMPTGSGGTASRAGERKPLRVDEAEGDAAGEEKKDPVKSAFALGAEATRRRNLVAGEGVGAGELGECGAGKLDWVGEAVWVPVWGRRGSGRPSDWARALLVAPPLELGLRWSGK